MKAVSDEHDERVHQDISQIEKKQREKWSPSVLADFCWSETSHGENKEAKEEEVRV